MIEQIRLSYRSIMGLMGEVGSPLTDSGLVNFCVLRGVQKINQGSASVLAISVDEEDEAFGDEANDLFLMAYKDEEGEKLEGYQCTSQPHRKYKNRPGGAAILPVYTELMYVQGMHRGHLAYTALNGDYVVRDVNRDGKISTGDTTQSGRFGVNIHASGLEGKVVSAGCIVINATWDSDDWDRIKRWLMPAQTGFPAIVIPGWDVVRWEDLVEQDRYLWRPSIAFGTKGSVWVRRLQKELKERLKERLNGLKIDGHWGRITQAAVENVLKQDVSAMTPKLWEKLEGETGVNKVTGA
jgi:hypothetical protein